MLALVDLLEEVVDGQEDVTGGVDAHEHVVVAVAGACGSSRVSPGLNMGHMLDRCI